MSDLSRPLFLSDAELIARNLVNDAEALQTLSDAVQATAGEFTQTAADARYLPLHGTADAATTATTADAASEATGDLLTWLNQSNARANSDGILFLSDQGLSVSGAALFLDVDSRLYASPYVNDSVAVVVRILGFVYDSSSLTWDLGANNTQTVLADKWGAWRLLFAITQSDTNPHIQVISVADEQSYDTEAEALADVPDAPLGTVSAGIIVLQSDGVGFESGVNDLIVGVGGVTAITIHQPDILEIPAPLA